MPKGSSSLEAEIERLERLFGDAALTRALVARAARRGPGPIEFNDEAALLAMRMIVAEDPEISVWAVARRIAAAGIVGNSPDSTAWRLYRKFKKSDNENLKNCGVAYPIGEFVRSFHRLRQMFEADGIRIGDFVSEFTLLQAMILDINLVEEAAALAGINAPLRALSRLT